MFTSWMLHRRSGTRSLVVNGLARCPLRHRVEKVRADKQPANPPLAAAPLRREVVIPRSPSVIDQDVAYEAEYDDSGKSWCSSLRVISSDALPRKWSSCADEPRSVGSGGEAVAWLLYSQGVASRVMAFSADWCSRGGAVVARALRGGSVGSIPD